MRRCACSCSFGPVVESGPPAASTAFRHCQTADQLGQRSTTMGSFNIASTEFPLATSTLHRGRRSDGRLPHGRRGGQGDRHQERAHRELRAQGDRHPRRGGRGAQGRGHQCVHLRRRDLQPEDHEVHAAHKPSSRTSAMASSPWAAAAPTTAPRPCVSSMRPTARPSVSSTECPRRRSRSRCRSSPSPRPLGPALRPAGRPSSPTRRRCTRW